jgi:hypothetical protein
VLGPSDSTAEGYDKWLGASMTELGKKLGCNVRHAQYDNTKKEYGAWRDMYTVGPERSISIPATVTTSPPQIPNSEVPITSDDIKFDIGFYFVDWYDGISTKFVLSQRAGEDNRAFDLYLNSSGAFTFEWSSDGAVMANVATFWGLTTADFVDGQYYTFRFILDVDNGAGGHTATMYYSTDRGDTWTKVEDVVGAGVTSVFKSTSAYALFTSNPAQNVAASVGNVREVRIYDGIDGRVVNPQPIETWLTGDLLNEATATVEGTPTIYVFNAGIGGANFSTFAAITQYAPNMSYPVVYISLGYNQGYTNGPALHVLYDTLIEAIKSYVTKPLIVMVSRLL